MTTPAPTVVGPSRTPVPHRTTTTLLALVLPTLVSIAASVVALGWADRLPDRIATHWGPDGVDGFSSLTPTAIWLPATGVGIALLVWALGFFFGQAAMTRRFAVGTAVWASTFVAGMLIAILLAQLDLTDPAEARGLGGSIAVVVAGSLTLAVLGAIAVPGDPARPATAPIPTDAAQLGLPDSEQASWVRRVETVHPGVLVVAVAVLAVTITAASDMWWLGLLLAVVLGPMLVALTAWTITVDRRGLVARSRVAWPRLVVPIEEVERADVVAVNPIKDFGGWGMRIGPGGRVGVVLRRGEAIEVRRTGGRVVVVTVDDASTGAALLNTLAARSRTAT